MYILARKYHDRIGWIALCEDIPNINCQNAQEDDLIQAVVEWPDIINIMDNPSEAVQLAAIRGDHEVVSYIHEPVESVMLQAILGDPTSIRYITRPSPTLQIAAFYSAQRNSHIDRGGDILYYIDYQCTDVKQLAMDESPLNIEAIKRPSMELQQLAVEHDPSLVKKIHPVSHPKIAQYVLDATSDDGLRDWVMSDTIRRCGHDNGLHY